MRKELITGRFHAGDFISETAVRGELDGRSRTLCPAPRSRRLRRWSVAELMARAVLRPPARDVAH
jgi:hypothetical protein